MTERVQDGLLDGSHGAADVPLLNIKRSFGRFVHPGLFDPKSFINPVDAAKAAKTETPERIVDVREDAPFLADDLLDHVVHHHNSPDAVVKADSSPSS